MGDLAVEIGKRAGRETCVVMRFGTRLEAQSVWRVLGRLSQRGYLAPQDYIVLSPNRQGCELVLVLASSRMDRDTQLKIIADACYHQLGLSVCYREMRYPDYDFYVRMARAAMAPNN